MFLFLPPLLSFVTWNLPQLASSLRMSRAPICFALFPSHIRMCNLTLHGKNESAGKFLFFSHSAVGPSLFCFPSAAAAGFLFYTRERTRAQVFICLSTTSAPCSGDSWKTLYWTASADTSGIKRRKRPEIVAPFGLYVWLAVAKPSAYKDKYLFTCEFPMAEAFLLLSVFSVMGSLPLC